MSLTRFVNLVLVTSQPLRRCSRAPGSRLAAVQGVREQSEWCCSIENILYRANILFLFLPLGEQSDGAVRVRVRVHVRVRVFQSCKSVT